MALTYPYLRAMRAIHVVYERAHSVIYKDFYLFFFQLL